jgi:hypothetical protein
MATAVVLLYRASLYRKGFFSGGANCEKGLHGKEERWRSVGYRGSADSSPRKFLYF